MTWKKERCLTKSIIVDKYTYNSVSMQVSFQECVCVCVCVCVCACVGSDVYVSCWNLADHRMEEWTENVGWE